MTPFIGTTISYHHLRYLNLDIEYALGNLSELNFDFVRLPCYWSDSQPVSNTFDFTRVVKILDFLDNNHIKTVFTIGIKSPRWPEYHLPGWINDKKFNDIEPYLIKYIKKALSIINNYSCIDCIQVENEPLDQSGPDNLSIPIELLKQEVELVKKDCQKPVLITLWGNELSKRKFLPQILPLCDMVGLDLYYQMPISKSDYVGPSDSDTTLQSIIRNCPKPVWITELQAEPWEYKTLVSYLDDPKSMNTNILTNNFTRASDLNPEAIFFWGYEYWLMKKQKKDFRLWEAVDTIIKHKSTRNNDLLSR